MWITYFILDIIIPLVMLIAGVLSAKKPPKNINALVGYRTERSQKSKQAWDFAQKYFGILFLKTGVAVFAVTLVASLAVLKSSEKVWSIECVILIVLQTISVFVPIILTEKKLKSKFDGE